MQRAYSALEPFLRRSPMLSVADGIGSWLHMSDIVSNREILKV